MSEPTATLILIMLLLILSELSALRGRPWWLWSVHFVVACLVLVAFKAVERLL